MIFGVVIVGDLILVDLIWLFLFLVDEYDEDEEFGKFFFLKCIWLDFGLRWLVLCRDDLGFGGLFLVLWFLLVFFLILFLIFDIEEEDKEFVCFFFFLMEDCWFMLGLLFFILGVVDGKGLILNFFLVFEFVLDEILDLLLFFLIFFFL